MVVSRIVEPSRYLSHERIYFNGKLHAGHIHTTRSPSVVPRFRDDRFLFLEFVFFPLKSFKLLKSEQGLESSIKYGPI